MRPLAVSDTLTNLFESVLLQEMTKEHTDHQKQFGFRKSSSCQHAIYVLKRAIKLNNKNKKRLYACAIDATKAFDKMSREILWSILIYKKINPAIVITLMKYYDESYMLVANNDEISTIFRTKVGVKQGGVLSPKLFSIYIENLLTEIERLNSGVTIGNLKIDIIGYADDLLLISDTKIGLQNQLQVVEAYGKQHEIKYNPAKTTLLIFNKNSRIRKNDKWQGTLYLDNQMIKEVNSMKYLGVEINNKNTNVEHIDKRRKGAVFAANNLRMNNIISEYTNPFLIAQLYKTFIRPVLLYGNEVLDLKKGELNTLKRTENNIIKKLLNIPIRSRTTWLINALNIEPIDIYLENQKLNFIKRLTENKYTRSLVKHDLRNEQINDMWVNSNFEYLTTCKNLEELKSTCQYAQYVNKTDLKHLKKNCDKTKEVRRILTGHRKNLNMLLREVLNYEKYE